MSHGNEDLHEHLLPQRVSKESSKKQIKDSEELSQKKIKNSEELSEKQVANSQETEIETSNHGGMLFPLMHQLL